MDRSDKKITEKHYWKHQEAIEKLIISDINIINNCHNELEKRIKEKNNSEIRELIKNCSNTISMLEWNKFEDKRIISKRLRFYILDRDNYTCNYCWSKAPDVKLHIDHKIPWSIWWKTTAENLITACADCNLWKHNLYTN